MTRGDTPLKPLLIMDQHFRRIEELFRPGALESLGGVCSIFGGANRPMARQDLLCQLPNAEFVVAAKPELNAAELSSAKNLKAIIEVSGTCQAG